MRIYVVHHPIMNTERSTLPRPFDPATWEDAALYREATLCIQVPPRAAEAFRISGRDTYLAMVEWKQGSDDPVVPLTLAAVARDLRWAQGALESLGSMGQPTRGKRLALKVARALAGLAAKMEQVALREA